MATSCVYVTDELRISWDVSLRVKSHVAWSLVFIRGATLEHVVLGRASNLVAR